MSKQATRRVSARTERMEFGEKYGTKYCIPEWLRDEQIKIAMRKVSGRVVPVETTNPEPVAVCGFGPSLKEHWEQVRGYKVVFTASGAHKYLLERGIVPTYHVEVDPRDHKIGLLGPADKRVIYLPSSTSHPKYLDHLLASGAELRLWHVFTNEAEGQRILPRGEWAVTGGADAGLRAIVLARLLGYTNVHVFGIDGSAGHGDSSHADKHPNAPGKFFDMEYPQGSGRIYRTTPALYSCARSVPHEVSQLKDTKVTFHGEGLVQAIMREQGVKKPAGDTLLAFVKPDLISHEYRELNSRLHEDNPAYGTSGAKHAETVLRLSKSLGTTSILDYGCGKGRLAASIPFPIWEYDPAIAGKDEAPRPADIVVCTDVLEHIEPENLQSVLADLARCVQKVGFFVIHTGAAGKVLADGRNAHLIQQGRAWWEKKLGRWFDVAKVLESGPELHIVVGPKTKKPPMDEIVKVEHDGTVAKFHVVNDTTKWRAETLFKKEPATIAWIDTFNEGEVLWDIGANVGGYTVWASRRRGVKVYAFEPEAQNYALLCRNMALNKVDGLAYCLALGREQKADALYTSTQDVGGSCNSFGQEVGPDLQPRKGIPQGAFCISGDSLYGVPMPDHIKIDVDGLEHDVIEGLGRALESAKSILLEVNENLPEHRLMVEALQGSGFAFDPAQVDASRRKEGAFKGCAEYVLRRRAGWSPEIVEPAAMKQGISVLTSVCTTSAWPSEHSFIPSAEERAKGWVLDAVREAQMHHDPFPHLYIEDVFPTDFYATLLKSLPKDGWRSLSEARGTDGYPERSVNEAPSCVRWMLDGWLRDLLNEKFCVNAKSDELLLLRDRTGYKIPPHTDTPRKVVTALFYLPKNGKLAAHGTSVYRPKQAGFRCEKGAHHKFEDFERVWTAPFRPNSVLIFARSDVSFHGVEPFDGEGVRDILLYDTRK